MNLRTFKKLSIKHKLILIIMATSLAVIGVSSTIIIVWNIIEFRCSIVQQLSTNAEIIGKNSTAAIEFNDPESAQEILSALSTHENIESACIYSNDGSEFATYFRNRTMVNSLPDTSPQTGHYFENGYVYVFQPIYFNEELIGTVCLYNSFKCI